MRKLVSVIGLLLLGLGQVWASDNPFGGIRLLEGYHINQARALDARTWTIAKKGGPRIDFEAGPSEGMWADPKNKRQYAWYKEQTVNGYKVQVALIKPGVKTGWEPAKSQVSEPGNIVLVTFILDEHNLSFTANFAAKVTSPEEIVDVLLMVLTFDPSKAGL